MRSRAQSYRNLDGLQADRDAVNWYWRLTAAASSTMILGGFLMLPATYVKADTLRVNQTAIGIFGIAILTAGFSFSALLTFTIRNPLFQADAIHQPCALASIVGLLTVFYDFIISSSYTWKTPTLLLAIAAGLSTIIYASLFLLSHRRISKIRSRPQPNSSGGSSIHPLTLTSPSRTSFASPATPYEPSTLEPTESRRPSTYQSPGFYENYIRNMYPTSAHSNTNNTNNNNPGAPTSSTGDLSYDPHSISEEEMQRQQMLMLLLANEQPPRQQQQQSTFHIDWQGQDGDGDETPAHGYYAPGVGTGSSASDGGVGTGGSWPTPPPPPLPTQPQQQPSPGRRWKGALKPWDGVWRGVARRGEGQERLRVGEQQQMQQQQQQLHEQQQQMQQHQLRHQASAEGREERRREIELGYR
jgi:hypothetical protein